MTSDIKILYEDKDILVVHKPAGLATQSGKVGTRDLVSELKKYLFQQQDQRSEPYIGLIHRLDQPVEGLLVVAKNPKAAKEMNRQLLDGSLNKDYCALVYGIPAQEGILIHWLKQDKKQNRSDVAEQGTDDAKKAELFYKIIEKRERCSLVQIHLATGRHHQIRVQFSATGHPLLGDSKYETSKSHELSKELNLHSVALCANKLVFTHPVHKKKLEFEITPGQFQGTKSNHTI